MNIFIKFLKLCLKSINWILGFFDLELSRITRKYISAYPTIKAAKKAGKSICGYIEDMKFKERGDLHIKGRRNRIIQRMKEFEVFKHCDTVCEIGPGTGMYLEKVKEETNCRYYKIYEIGKEWSKYLVSKYNVKEKQCDGFSLKLTPDKSMSLVHAHAAFVYIPFLNILDYLTESFRVIKDNGFIVFDLFTENSFLSPRCEKWRNGEHRFPVIIPENFFRIYQKNNFYIYKKFNEIYGAGISEYFVLKRNSQ